jgi:endonuclease/exonuclease/phosphatase family metal-dependent hydrolase
MSASLRVLTFNLWVGAELERRLVHVTSAIAALRPDAVLLQEVRSGPSLRNTAEQIAAGLGWSGVAFASQLPADRAELQGVAIIAPAPLHSVYTTPLPHKEGILTYVMLSARLTHAGRQIALHTTHLRWRPVDSKLRSDQARAVLSVMQAYGGDVQIVGGDFNAAPQTQEIGVFRNRLVDSFGTRHPDTPGITWARRNPNTGPIATTHGLKRDRRIDYLFVGPSAVMGNCVLDCDVVLDQPVQESGKPLWLSDHFGLLARFDLPDTRPVVA